MRMPEQLKTLVKTQTAAHSGITFLGTAINGILGALFYIVVARSLGPENFGLLAIAVASLTLVADIADLGTDTGIINFVGQYISRQEKLAYQFLKLALETRIIVALLVAVLGYLVAPAVAELVFEKAALTDPLRLAFVGVSSAQLFAYVLSCLVALQKFWWWSNIQISTNALRLTAILGLSFASSLSLMSSLSVYIVVPMLGFLASWLFLPKNILNVKNEWSVAGQLFSYSRWIALSVLVTAISSRLDTLISGRLLEASEVGFYAAALQLTVVVPQVMRAIETVIAPRMSAIRSENEFRSYLKNTQLLVGGLSIAGLMASPLVLLLIPLVYGPAYALAVPPIFLILLLAMMLFLLSAPTHNAINYYFGFPKLFTVTSLINLIVGLLLGWILISNFGVMGAAWTVVAQMMINLVIPGWWVMHKLKLL